ncbi:MAG: helix-turn-helix transcriptional regulator, partial [Actinomycetota bacterium]|nr:helix-turn-helix transcriptional regulator [Actinomycetota bacterium]
HGYAVAQALKQRSGGVFDLPEGTIYPALHRLERAQLLSSAWATAAGRRRRVYQLTARGRRSVSAARRDWRRFADAVEAVIA